MIEDRVKSELSFRTSRSSGPGGQSVNKTETRVEAVFTVASSYALSEDEKLKVFQRLANRINKQGELVVAASDSRSQLTNKELAQERLISMLQKALLERKPRRETRPTKASVQKNRRNKEQRSELKKGRGWKFDD